ncbi:MAG: multicopper oxidase domain-containing protein [Gammaproteobacteria bacterium]
MTPTLWRMKSRTCLWATLAFVFLCAVCTMPQSGFAAAVPAAAIGACGSITHPHGIVEPPDVDMWNAPVDASGDHELILVVHRDDDRFCYRYHWNGAVQTVAPAIHVRRGEQFAIRIVNDIASQSLGESAPSTAISACKPMTMPSAPVQHWVGYLNHVIDDRYFHVAATDTNLHLHGFEGPASEENIFLSTLSTPMHACEYRVTIPRTQPPGTYLYHPHAHGSSDDELAGGLAGVWVVEPDSPQIPRADEHVLLLRYRIPFANDVPAPNIAPFMIAARAYEYESALRRAAPVSYDPFNPPGWPVTFPMNDGGIKLDPTGCMGKLFPEAVVSVDNADTPASLTIPAGRTQLLRIVNATSDSSKLLRIRDTQGHVLPFRVVERDGVPVSGDMQHPLAHYISMQELMLSPMSRADVLLTATPGADFVLSSEPYCGGTDQSPELHHNLLRITAVADIRGQVYAVRSAPVTIADTPAARLMAWVHAHPTRVHRRAITFTEYAFPKRGKIPLHLAYYITDTTNPNFHEQPFWPVYRPGATVPSNPDIVVKQGTIEEWYLINATMETHAFHIHQMAFVQVRNYIGIPVTVDTVFVPVGKLLPNPSDLNYPLIQPSITKVILDFRHVPRGTFVFHCHMLYHEDHGMMGVIRVE